MTSLKLIDEKIESDKSKDWRRPHLGGSGIGDECARKIWYTFRWFTEPKFEGRILRLFRRGHGEEITFIDDLRSIGAEVTTGPGPGRQWSFGLLGHHFAGSIDGAAKGLPELGDDWGLLEFKTHNEKSFNDLVKRGLKTSKPMHFDQIQIYGHALGFSKALYFAVCKNDDRRYSEMVEIDESHGEDLTRKAEHIIVSKTPLPKLSKSPAFFYCKWCTHLEVCHYDAKPEVNCRTCIHSKAAGWGIESEKPLDTPEGGAWLCENTGKELSLSEQKAACGHYSKIS